jgi:hypothetical protein
MNHPLEKIMAKDIEVWQRKLKKDKSSYYVCIPKPLIQANVIQKNAFVRFIRCYDEKSGRILMILDINP